VAGKKTVPQYTDKEIERRALEMVQRSFVLPHKTKNDFVGKTPRARAMARKRKAKNPKSP
jgi:hypothetical protein